MAELREDALVLGIDDPSRPNLKGDVVTFETIALDGDGELPVPLSLPCCAACRLVDVSQGTVSSMSFTSFDLRLMMTRSGF